jgi:hypothetical protein
MTAPNHLHQHHVTVTPSKPAAALQMVQGGYYVLAGLLVALAVETITGPTDYPERPASLWPVRVVALAVAGLGVALIASGRTAAFTLPAWTGMWAALLLLLLTVVGMGMGVLPMTFLIDTALEALFLGCWVVTGASRVSRGVERSTPLPSV